MNLTNISRQDCLSLCVQPLNDVIDKALYKFTIFSKMAECLKNRINFKFQILKSLELMGTVPFYLKTTYYFPYFF